MLLEKIGEIFPSTHSLFGANSLLRGIPPLILVVFLQKLFLNSTTNKKCLEHLSPSTFFMLDCFLLWC